VAFSGRPGRPQLRPGRWAGWVLAALLGLFPTAGAAADFAKIGPQATVADIIGQRPSTGLAVLKLQFAENRNGEAHALRIGIGADFVVIDDGTLRTILDCRLRRRIVADASRKTFANGSLYALVDFFSRETLNRLYQRNLVRRATGSTASLGSPFWSQSELHLVAAEDEQVPIDRNTGSDGVTHVVVGKEEVASFAPSDETLSPVEAAGLSHVLLIYTSLHPAIVKAIIESGRLPRTFSYAISRSGRRGEDSWTLTKAERITANYPLPADYKPDVDITTPSVRTVLPRVLDAIAHRNAPRPLAAYREDIARAHNAKQGVQTYLIGTEALLQYGEAAFACGAPDPCKTREALAAVWNGDTSVAPLRQASEAEARGDLKTALSLRLSVSRHGLSDAYVLDDLIGNTYAEMGDFESALKYLPLAVEGNPFVASFYKDLGDVFLGDYNSFDAWILYDLARALPGGETAPVIDSVTENEKALAKAYPQFF
jgi:hypothetical protein